jgi:hypothetical protein
MDRNHRRSEKLFKGQGYAGIKIVESLLGAIHDVRIDVSERNIYRAERTGMVEVASAS